jgi:hypothetical protein
MDVARESHLGDERDQTSWYTRTIRLLDTNLQMRSLDGTNYFFAS